MQKFLESARDGKINGYGLHGLLVMERGFIFTCMILAAACACLVDRKFLSASAWAVAAALLTGIGLCHAYQLSGNTLDYLLLGQTPTEGAAVYRAWDVAGGYIGMAVVFLVAAWMQKKPSTAPLPVAE
jgi:AGZA family xanthine/uracil permease-like MFS transporter